jgi:hypothetical protein
MTQINSVVSNVETHSPVVVDGVKYIVNISANGTKYISYGPHNPSNHKIYAYDMTDDRFAYLQAVVFDCFGKICGSPEELYNFALFKAGIEAEIFKPEVAKADLDFGTKAMLKFAKSEYNRLLKLLQTEPQIIDYFLAQKVDKSVISQVCLSYKPE